MGTKKESTSLDFWRIQIEIHFLHYHGLHDNASHRKGFHETSIVRILHSGWTYELVPILLRMRSWTNLAPRGAIKEFLISRLVEALNPSRNIEENGLIAFSSCFLAFISLFYYSVQDFSDRMQKDPLFHCWRQERIDQRRKKYLHSGV